MRLLTNTWDTFLAEELGQRTETGLLRSLRSFKREGAWLVAADGRRLLDLSSNDYLGLASHPAVREAAARAASRQTGATASRLIAGTDPAVSTLEERLAEFQKTEAALVYGSGYLANLGVVSALAGSGDAIFSDQLNHASIIDGCRLSRATVHRYGHRDLDQLETLLQSADRQGVRRKLIITESVFSMDGDIAPLAEIAKLKDRYGAALIVDEAHADGLYGPHGQGYAHQLGIADHIDLHIGTFGKAFGAYGAYVAGSSLWIRYLINASRSFIFTTALPPTVIAAVDTALDLVRAADQPRSDLQEKTARFRNHLVRLGLDTRGSSTQIIPIVVGESTSTLSLAQALEQAGVLAVAIRPPTVPQGTARLRCSLSAQHDDADLDRALTAIEQATAELSQR